MARTASISAGSNPMDRVPARGEVDERPDVAVPGPPPVHRVVGHLPERTRPAVHEPGGDGLVDGLEDQLLRIGGDPRRERTGQPQPPVTSCSRVERRVVFGRSQADLSDPAHQVGCGRTA